MGVVYYLVSDECKETYCLGGGYWGDCGPLPSVEELKETACRVSTDYDASRGQARRFANELAQWATERGGKVRLMNDADDGFSKLDEYADTGSVYDRKELSNEDIRQRVEQVADDLRHELGADEATVSVVIEGPPPYMIDEPDERHYWEYTGTSGYDKQSSGYRMRREYQEPKE